MKNPLLKAALPARLKSPRLGFNWLQHNHQMIDLSDDNGERGSTTVEYAIGAIATAGFAGLLVMILKSGGVQGLIQNIIETALAI